jgi:two-component system, sensor histidine kinase LadS
MAEQGVRRMRLWLLTLVMSLLLCTGLAAAASSRLAPDPLDVATPQRLDLSPQVQVCASRAEAGIEQVLQGDCEWDPRSPPSVSRGFDRRAFWLRLELVNRGALPVERLLSVGHPRLQEVSLYRVAAAGRPLALGSTGTRVAMADKPVPLPRPTFRLEFKPGETQTLWLRVASETIIEFAPKLQPVESGYFRSQRLQLFQAIVIGCMLLCFCYSAATYLILREKSLLFFSSFMLSELIVELARSGLLQTYLWPASLPFDSRVLVLGAAGCIGSIWLFLHGFVANLRSHRRVHGLSRVSLAVFHVGVLWCLLIDYRTGTVVWTYAVLAWILTVLLLLIMSWRQGSKTAKLLLQGFMLLMAVELLRLLSVTGRLDFSEIESLGNPIAIALTSSVILIGMIRRLREMQIDLAQTRAERAASLSFMSQMSHELRSPLSTLVGQTRLLEQNEIPQRARQIVASMRQDAAQLLAMIDEILDYAQGTAGKQVLRCRARSWSGLTRRIEQRAEILTQVNGNRLEFHHDGPAEAIFLVDERRLLQVLSNLLGNAASYCRDGVIELDCRIHQAQPGCDWKLEFSVRDSGPGIALEDQQRIFQPFERGADAHLSHHKGVGMGLAISRQLVELLGGQLTLVSETGRGSQFSFSISCHPAQADELDWDDEEPAVATVQLEPTAGLSPLSAPTAEARDIAYPDQDQLDRLRVLAENGQISDMLEMMDALQQAEPGWAPFCDQVRDLALQLDLESIRVLCAGQRQA